MYYKKLSIIMLRVGRELTKLYNICHTIIKCQARRVNVYSEINLLASYNNVCKTPIYVITISTEFCYYNVLFHLLGYYDLIFYSRY